MITMQTFRISQEWVCSFIPSLGDGSVEEIPDKERVVVRTADYLELIKLESKDPPGVLL